VRLVLDTNVVLDWLVFADPSVASLRTTQVELAASAATLGELRRVLNYPKLKLTQSQRSSVFSQYRRAVVEFDPPPAPAGLPRCRDPDDQPFLWLALHANAVLVSRDKAVLALRQRTARFGVQIADIRGLSALLT
jgi:uncharacterized protein